MSIVTVHGPTMYYNSETPFVRQLKPFPGHWVGPKYIIPTNSQPIACYQRLYFCPIDVIAESDKIGWRVANTAEGDPVTLVVAGCDENGWPGPIVAALEASSGGGDIEVDCTLSPGRYWFAVVSYDDDTYAIYAASGSPGSYALLPADTWPSMTAIFSSAFDTYIANDGLVVVHAATVGGDYPDAVETVPEVIVPGVANGQSGAPIILVRTAV